MISKFLLTTVSLQMGLAEKIIIDLKLLPTAVFATAGLTHDQSAANRCSAAVLGLTEFYRR
jgi:hypothetical protein